MAERDPVLIVTGPPGAGKTTAARLLAASRQRAAHLESDRFFHFVASGYVEPWKPEAHEQNTVVMGIVGRAAAAYADAGYFTIVDGIVSPRWFYVPLRDALRAAGHRVAYAVLRAPLDVCVARAAGRDEPRLAERPVVEQLWRDFADLGPLERHAIDTGATSAEATAEALARRLRDGRGARPAPARRAARRLRATRVRESRTTFASPRLLRPRPPARGRPRRAAHGRRRRSARARA